VDCNYYEFFIFVPCTRAPLLLEDSLVEFSVAVKHRHLLIWTYISYVWILRKIL